MLIGYARISTATQSLELQTDALKAAGCEKTFTDTLSGSITGRPGLQKALKQVRAGDTLIVWRLDRLGRSLQHLIGTVTALQERGVNIKSLSEQIDTTTPTGKLMLHVFASLAEFERDLTLERTLAGMAAAKARGRIGGRPRAIKDSKKIEEVRRLFKETILPVEEIAKKFKVSRATVYRMVKV